MIVLDLTCHHGHRFEGWFASREAFDTQSAQGMVQCGVCQSVDVAAMPSGPYVRRGGGERLTARHDVEPVADAPSGQSDSTPVMSTSHDAGARLFNALAAMARGAVDVGDRFADEARRIHYKEAPPRTIRGVASRDETRELLDEGIMVLPALVPKPSDTH